MSTFIISDIDHTLSTFDDAAGMRALRKYMDGQLNNQFAQRICNFMDRCYAAFHARAKGKDSKDLAALESMIKEASQDIEGAEGFGDLHWSRELWIYIAAAGALSPQSCVGMAEHFWEGVAQESRIYEDAYRFLSWIRDYKQVAHSMKTILVTSSDARLAANHENTRLVYDCGLSLRKKIYHLGPVLRSLPVGRRIFVGDPVGKPHPEFWQEVIRYIGYNQEDDLAIMVGDSYRADIVGVSQFGIIPVLIDREGKTKPEEVPEAKYVIRSMAELPGIISRETIQKQNRR